MAKYLLIESRNPSEAGNVNNYYGLARDLAAAGNDVTLFLVQNAVMPARKGARNDALDAVAGKMKVLADDFSLRERAIPENSLMDGVEPSPIDTVVDLLAEGAKAVWH